MSLVCEKAMRSEMHREEIVEAESLGCPLFGGVSKRQGQKGIPSLWFLGEQLSHGSSRLSGKSKKVCSGHWGRSRWEG